MTARTFKSRLLGAGSLRAALVFPMAVAGIMAAQAVTTEASASLNGDFPFSLTDNATYGGGTNLASATFLSLPPSQNAVRFVPTLGSNGIVNNFYSPTGTQITGYSIIKNSDVDISTGVSGNVLNVADASGLPLIPNFLTFSFTTSSAPGTTPDNRFSYTMSDIVWERGTITNSLAFNSTGFLTDSQGRWTGQVATLNAAFTTNCPKVPVAGQECHNFNGIFDFQTLGDGNVQNIPEPVSLSLLGIGIAGLVAARRRRI